MNPLPFLNRSDAAVLLREKRSLILRQWETLARREIPAARDQDRPTLLDSLPDFLEELADALARKDTKARVPKEHVEHRSELREYSFEAVIKEYHLLRRVLFQHIEEDAPLDREARAVIEGRLDLGIEEAASRFARLAQNALREDDEVRRQLEARHEAILRAALDAIIQMDHEGKVVEWNPSAENLFGYARQDALGKEMADLIIPPALRDRHRRGLAYYLETGIGPIIGQRLELPAVRADGRGLLVELTVTHIPSDGPPLFTGYLRDITEQRSLEEDLRNVLSSAECLLWHGEVRELESGWLHWTTQFFDVEGVERKIPVKVGEGETYGAAWHKSRLPEDRERADREANEAIRSGRDGYQQEFRHRLADGQVVWFLQRVNIEKVDEKRWRLVGVCIDITERKRAEEERNNILRHARCILFSAEVVRRESEYGPWLEWRTLRFDEEAAQAVLPLEILPGEDYATAWWRSRHTEDDVRMGAESRRAFLSGQDSYRQEFRCTDRYGQERWLYEDVSIQSLGEGQWRAVGVVTEITERKRLELALHERAEALTEADRRKDQFLIMLAHELRNPLAPMMNAVHFLQKAGPQEPHLMRARGIIERQVHHQASLINDLLDAARISSGRIELHPEQLDLARLVKETADLYRGVFEERGLSLVLDVPDAPAYVQADPTRMAQVLGNLLDNAGKFTPSGGTVTVCLTEKGEQVQVVVEDTGIGIEESLLPTVFDTFTQADQSLDRARGGLGLGLSLVKSLVEAQRGQITLMSQGQDRGTKFTIELPVVEPEARAEKEYAASVCPPQRLRILIIEDNPDAAQSLMDLLDLYGYEVQVAFDGVSGLERFEAMEPDVVLCDIGLPRMDGFEVARQIRQRERRNTHLVAITGYGQAEDRQKAKEAGFEELIAKPVPPEVLLEKLSGVQPQHGEQTG